MAARPRGDSIRLMTLELSVMMRSGIGIVRALEAAGHTSDVALREILVTMRRQVESGRYLSECLALQRPVFSELYVGSVRVAEKSGRLAEVFGDLAEQLGKEHTLGQRIRAALAYPALIVLFASLLVLFLLEVQVPTFLQLFRQTGAEIPAFTRLVLAVSRPELAFVAAGLASLGAIVVWRKWQVREGRLELTRIVHRLPVVGRLFRMTDSYRFASQLACMIHFGVDLLGSLATLAEVFADAPDLGEALPRVREGILSGQSLPGALEAQGFPRLMVALMTAAEESGRLSAGLQWYARLVEEDVETTVETLALLLEPLLMGLLGLAVMLIVLASFLPAYQLMTRF